MGESASTYQRLSPTDVEIRCSAQHSALSLIRLFVRGVAREMGFDDEVASEIELCVDEACANVIDHAYPHGAPPSSEGEKSVVGVEVRILSDALTISIADNGVGRASQFESSVANLAEYQGRDDPDGGRPRGLGLYIINKLMDEVSVEFPNEYGTRLTMTKRLPVPTEGPARGRG
jgi:serine/threonine-protein kinase RsbW